MPSQPLQFAFALLGIGVISAFFSHSTIIPAGAFIGCGLAAIGHAIHVLAVVYKDGQVK